MAPSGYLTVVGIEAALVSLRDTYPSLCELVVMPERTHEGRVSRAVRIGTEPRDGKRAVLMIGGVHAREIVNPDMLVYFAYQLVRAYDAGTDLVFGRTTYSNGTVVEIVENLALYIFPLVNPDGRAYVQAPNGDPWWRKNRNPNPGLSCQGVDLNRNFDFLWSSGIGTSANSCSQTYKGAAPFSEPETRNVRYLLDTYPDIAYFLDVHSYSELILHPWGDDNNQTTNPDMHFRNLAYDGLRGAVGDSTYREYIPEDDLVRFVDIGKSLRDAIAQERGRNYTVEQGIDLYPTTATSGDYAYSRHYVDAAKSEITAYVLETGREFQPPYSEAFRMITEVCAGLVNFCQNTMSIVTSES
jgi:murein tripeptide amidase MpaA